MNPTIAGLAREGGVGVETVRYYQRRGLLQTPARGEYGGIRRYDSDAIKRLRFIRTAQSAGFTLDEISELIELDATDDRPRAHAIAQVRITALDAKIAELTTVRDSLKRLALDCRSSSKGPCPIIESFDCS